MRTKTSLFRNFSSQYDYDVFVIIESWLNNDFYNEEFFDANLYTVYRKDRDFLYTGHTKGGGVLIAVKKCINSYTVALNDVNPLYDQLNVCVKTLKGCLYIGASYIPPKSCDELYFGHIQNFFALC